MKTTLVFRSLVLACLFSVLSAAVASAFEGKITMKMTHGKDAMPMTYYVKDTKMRMEMVAPPDKKGRSAGTFATITDWKALEAIILMPEQKMYMVQKLDKVLESDAVKKHQDMKFEPTGRKERIAGYDAEEYVGVSEGKRTEMWLTKGLGKFMMAQQGKPGRSAKQQVAAWEKFMQQGDFFALRLIQRTKEGSPEDFRMEVTQVEKTSQDDSLFRPPADFQRFEMPNMGDIMKGMIPGGGR
jgi:hypothetical protein